MHPPFNGACVKCSPPLALSGKQTWQVQHCPALECLGGMATQRPLPIDETIRTRNAQFCNPNLYSPETASPRDEYRRHLHAQSATDPPVITMGIPAREFSPDLMSALRELVTLINHSQPCVLTPSQTVVSPPPAGECVLTDKVEGKRDTAHNKAQILEARQPCCLNNLSLVRSIRSTPK